MEKEERKAIEDQREAGELLVVGERKETWVAREER